MRLPHALLLLLAATPVVAEAGEPTFAPDRPGLGESPATPGPGFATVEAGLAAALSEGAPAVITPTAWVRYGIDRGIEARLVLPTLALVDGATTVGPLALGAKVAGQPSERLGLSVVPELLIGPEAPTLGWRLSANAGLTVDRFAVWLNTTTTVYGEPSVIAGGGASVAAGAGGLYVNAGRELVADATFVGGGAWLGLSPTAQLDLGCDVWTGGALIVVPMFGASVAF